MNTFFFGGGWKGDEDGNGNPCKVGTHRFFGLKIYQQGLNRVGGFSRNFLAEKYGKSSPLPDQCKRFLGERHLEDFFPHAHKPSLKLTAKAHKNPGKYHQNGGFYRQLC